MNKKYKYLKYTPDFKSQIIQLQTHLWSPDLTLNSRYLEWKYEFNPYIETPFIYIALSGDTVVGMRGFFGAKWHIGHNAGPLTILCAGDLVIDPEHRSRGIFNGLMTKALDDVSKSGHKYVFNTSASKVTLIGSIAMGWRSIGSLETMYWSAGPRGKWNYPNKRFFRSSSERDHPFHFLDKKISKDSDEVSPYVSIDYLPKPREMAELVTRLKHNGHISHVRDQQYFEWRFQNPLSHYRFLYWRDKKLEGYLILQTSAYTDNIGWVSILDLEASSEHVCKDLIIATLRSCEFCYIRIWTSTLPEDTKAILKDCGFKILKEKIGVAEARPSILVRPTRDEMLNEEWIILNLELLDLNNWDIRMIFSDTY